MSEFGEYMSPECFVTTQQGVFKQWLPGQYIRDIEGVENMFARRKYHLHNIVQAIWLKSSKDITPEILKEAVIYSMRKYPVFHLCMGRRRISKGIRVMNSPVINLETLYGDPLEVYHGMLRCHYDYFNGPLWKMSLVYPNNLKKDVVIIFSIFHMITDAFTNMLILNDIVVMMNRILRDEQIINNPMTLDSYVIRDGILPFHEYRKEFVTFGIQHVQDKLDDIFSRSVPHILKVIKKTELVDAQTVVLRSYLSKAKTQQLMSMCKKQNVTLNSVVVAACACALVKTVEDKCASKLQNHIIKIGQAVDLRRYYQPQNKSSLGCHVSSALTTIDVPNSSIHNFWDISKTVHAVTQEQLTSKLPLKISQMVHHYARSKKREEKQFPLGKPPKTDLHFSTSNMKNLDKYFTSQTNDTIEIVDILRSVNKEYGESLLILTFHIFRERLLFSFDCFPTLISEEDSKKWFENLSDNLNNLSQTPKESNN